MALYSACSWAWCVLASFWMSGCSVVSDKRRPHLVTTSRRLSPKLNQIPPDKMWGKAIKYNFAFCTAGAAGDKGTFDSVSNTKYCIRAEKLRWPTQKLLWPPNVPSFSCGPSGTICPTLRTTDFDGCQAEWGRDADPSPPSSAVVKKG